MNETSHLVDCHSNRLSNYSPAPLREPAPHAQNRIGKYRPHKCIIVATHAPALSDGALLVANKFYREY